MSAFETAVADSKKLTSKPSNDDLLKLYGMLTACGNILVSSDGT
jgi:diazepam-binding inhibitor (GABA receptor modulating acyl-CoA-binding protein)